MQGTFFLLLLIHYWALTVFFWPVILSVEILDSQFDRSFSTLKIFDLEFDGMELLFKVNRQHEQFYWFTKKPNITVWFSITPCNFKFNKWEILAELAGDWNRYDGKPLVDYDKIFRKRSRGDPVKRRKLKNWASDIAGFLDGSNDVETTKRIEGQLNNIPVKTLIFSLDSSPQTMALFYASFRYSTTEPFLGFPRLDSDESLRKSIKPCVMKDNSLKLSFLSSTSTEMEHVDYCVAINEKRPLPNRCSAHMYIDTRVMPPTEKVRRQLADFTSHKLVNARYNCTSTSPIIFQNLHLHNTTYYINIYAVNRRTDLASSYPTFLWHPKDYPYKMCDRNVYKMQIKSIGNHVDHYQVVRLSTDLYITLTGEVPPNPPSNSYWYAWFQPCKLPPKHSTYEVKLDSVPKYGENSVSGFHCRVNVSRFADNICENRSLVAPGTYKITVKNDKTPEPNEIIGQMILSHLRIHGDLFPYLSWPGYSQTLGKVRLKFNCENNRLSANVYGYTLHRFCFYLSEKPDRPKPKKQRDLKRNLFRDVNLCFPSYLTYIETKCTSTNASEGFRKVWVHFDTELRDNTGYAVYVYYSIDRRLTDKLPLNDNIFPLYSINYVSVSQKLKKCRRRLKNIRPSRRRRVL